MLITAKIRVRGVVQGVGFRPFVHQISLECSLNGWVLNDSEGVLILWQGKAESVDAAKHKLITSPPRLSKITNVSDVPEPRNDRIFPSFNICESDSAAEVDTIVPSDSYVCVDCLSEMRDTNDRRYEYPFINCTNCGPRFSIIKSMPYDRDKTTMSEFEMCPSCQSEYGDINDRRYHAQPTACPDCGPHVWLERAHDDTKITNDCIRLAIEKLKNGDIVAIKSLGGFHFVVDAQNREAVDKLRKRKRRDKNPFALMVASAKMAEKYAYVNQEEWDELESVERPIVLLKKKDKNVLAPNVAPNNPNLGIMLPCAPLHHLMFNDPDLTALVMTSANISGYPIVYENDIARNQLSDVADWFLFNNRDIHIQVDDSLVRITQPKTGSPLRTLIRRSRGYAPCPVPLKTAIPEVFAAGAELKTTLAFSKGKNVYLSQHIGDLKNDDIFDTFIRSKEHLSDLLDLKPKHHAVDLHPNFRSSQYFLKQSDLMTIPAQHHHAHIASCMAENWLDNEKVIGVVYDGTGYGTDGTIWGGEIFIADYNSFERVAHISQFHLLGGDKAVKEPIRVAVSLLYNAFGAEAQSLELPVLDRLSENEKNVYFKMAERHINAIPCTSMGRLFDGISALLDICDKIEYEAQAAIELEGLLERDSSLAKPFTIEWIQDNGTSQLNLKRIVRDIVACIMQKDHSQAELSRRFHATIAYATQKICVDLAQKHNISKVVLSGGAFMNEYLLSNIYTLLQESGIQPYVHQLVPPNDGGIALGQIMIAAHHITSENK